MTAAIAPVTRSQQLHRALRRMPDSARVKWQTAMLAELGETGANRSFARYDAEPNASTRRGLLDEDHPGDIFDITV